MLQIIVSGLLNAQMITLLNICIFGLIIGFIIDKYKKLYISYNNNYYLFCSCFWAFRKPKLGESSFGIGVWNFDHFPNTKLYYRYDSCQGSLVLVLK
jgi:hypothetical protein